MPVLIRSESGPGKELVAGAIQRLSRRRGRGYQATNCADVTPWLLRSELFGHERGAVTGAMGKKQGLAIDVLECPQCGGRLRLIATLHEPVVIRKLLAHPGLAPSGPSPGPAPPEAGGVAP